jgi:hypothetical protein
VYQLAVIPHALPEADLWPADRFHINVEVPQVTYDTLAVERQGERFKHTCLLTS